MASIKRMLNTAMEDNYQYDKLSDIEDGKLIKPGWSKSVLKKIAAGLEAYLSILEPKATEGTTKINNEIALVKSLLSHTKTALSKQGDYIELIFKAGDYKLINDLVWKQWAALGQILRGKKEKTTIEGELEAEEDYLEDLRQTLELPFFQKLPRRQPLVTNLSAYYLDPPQKLIETKEVHLTKVWQIGEKLDGDKGGFGQVFNAKGEDGVEVVAKFVPKEPGASRELLFIDLKGVRNVVPIIDSGETDSDYVLIMPRAEKSLRRYIHENGTILLEDAIPILLDVLATLEDLEGKVVHRDIKPENILLLNGKWCLADFGISRYAEMTTSSHSHKFSMSPPYAAPERWRAQRATAATDVYALGIVGYELVSGIRPFSGPEPEDYREQHLSERPARLSAGPSPFADLIDETLYKPQESRPRPSNFATRLSSIAQPSPTIVIEALQQANSAEVNRKAENAVKTSKVQTEMERRTLLQDAAIQSLEKISLTLRDAITSSAPSAELARGSNVTWFIRMNYATLEFTPITIPIITDWEYADPPSIEVVAMVDLVLKTTKPNYGKEGRSHSLWYCDAKEKGQFEWHEVAFMLSPLYSKSSSMEPFALDPGRDAALALTPTMAHVQAAWPFTALKDENLVEFVQRWGTWFALTSQNGYQLPDQMPEKNTGTWRR
jgi:eukaryotic-like serine/threonine-protein kinase